MKRAGTWQSSQLARLADLPRGQSPRVPAGPLPVAMLVPLLELDPPTATSFALGAVVMVAFVVVPLFYMYTKNRGPSRGRHVS